MNAIITCLVSCGIGLAVCCIAHLTAYLLRPSSGSLTDEGRIEAEKNYNNVQVYLEGRRGYTN